MLSSQHGAAEVALDEGSVPWPGAGNECAETCLGWERRVPRLIPGRWQKQGQPPHHEAAPDRVSPGLYRCATGGVVYLALSLPPGPPGGRPQLLQTA